VLLSTAYRRAGATRQSQERIRRSTWPLRITEYSDDTLRALAQPIDFGSPRTNAEEWLGVRANAPLEFYQAF